MFVPDGYVPLRDALVLLAHGRNPEAGVRKYLKDRSSRGDPFRWAPETETPEWQALESARVELRQALGDGVIVAVGLSGSGGLTKIPATVWRSANGADPLYTGVLRERVGPTATLDSRVFIAMEELSRLLPALNGTEAEAAAASSESDTIHAVAGAELRAPTPRPAIAPAWVPIVGVDVWAERYFPILVGALPVTFYQQLASAVQRSEVMYRIAGLSPNAVTGRYPNGIYRRESPGRGVAVDDWEKAQPDWQDGTVGGWAEPSGQRRRHPIEIEWLALERWIPQQPFYWTATKAARQAKQAGAAVPSGGHDGSAGSQSEPTAADAQQAAETTPARPESNGRDRPSADAPPAINDAPTPPLADRTSEPPRPKPTEAAVCAWFQDRVASWPDDRPAPSEEVDWADARRHFGDGLRREDFRPIRAAKTPLEWQVQGRRKPWGQVKNSARNSAENSARLPPQK
jgi:hypothetical protein